MMQNDALARIHQIRSLRKYNAIAVDCGTGETKAMLLQYHRQGPNGPHVNVQQISKKLYPVTDFLDGRPVTDLSFLKGYEPADPAVAIATRLQPRHFVRYCEEQRELHMADKVIIGCSAWYRADHRHADPASVEYKRYRAARELVATLRMRGFDCRILHEKMESFFEAIAVTYAYSRMTGSDETPAGCLSGGSGSSQFAHGFSRFLCIERGNKQCKQQMHRLYDEEGSFDNAFKLLDQFANCTADCDVSRHIAEQQAKASLELSSDEERAAFAKKLQGSVVMISACYYAALEVGMANKDNTMKAYPAPVVLDAMGRKVEEYKTLLRNFATDPEAFPLPLNRKGKPGKPMDLLLPIVNLTLHRTLYMTLFDVENTELIFKRDWEFGTEKYRTTWTSGWFLNHLNTMFGIEFSGTGKVMDLYHGWERANPAAVAEYSTPLEATEMESSLGVEFLEVEDGDRTPVAVDGHRL